MRSDKREVKREKREVKRDGKDEPCERSSTDGYDEPSHVKGCVVAVEKILGVIVV